MKTIFVAAALLSLSACVVPPIDGGGNGGGKGGGDTVIVCHKGKKTMELPRSAAQGHLNHGDRAGPC